MTGMSLLSPPRPSEALRYLRTNGLHRALAKLVAGYIVGRQRWYVTHEDLTRYARLVPQGGYTLRFARADDLPGMAAFTERIAPGILRLWCKEGYYFFIALAGGQPVSYRCLSTSLHPGVVGCLRLRPGQIFMVDEFTVPAFRRRGITRRMAVSMAPHLLRLGFREVLGVHRTDNVDTIAAVRAKGIATIGTLTRSRALWKTWFTFEPASGAPPTAIPSFDPAVIVSKPEADVGDLIDRPFAGGEAG